MSMKKNKQKALVKESKKVAKQEIQQHIIEDLKKTVGKFGQTSKKMDKLIEKEAAQLAKKLSRGFKIAPSSDQEKKAEEIKPTATETVKQKQKSATKKTVKKPSPSKEPV